MLLTDSLLNDLIGIIVTLVVAVITYYKWSFTYWKRKGLDGLEPSIPFGNATDLFLGRRMFGAIWRDVYFYLKSKSLKHGGAYFCSRPVYIPVDIEIVKNILQNNFEHFSDHGFYVNEKVDPLTQNLFRLDGPRWKQMRTKLTPTFTASKMKMMFETLVECSEGLKNILKEFSGVNAPVDIKELTARLTTDVIGSCAFGIDCCSLKNPQSEFFLHGVKALNRDLKGTIKIFAQLLIPHSILRFFNFRAYHLEVINFFQNMVKQTVRYREENNIIRKDFMQLLIQLKNRGTVNENESIITENKLSLTEITAQAFVFFVAGSDTSSNTLTFATYELAINPGIQDKLREEINTILEKHDNKLTYEAVMQMTYLEKVICETLRKYPPIAYLPRVCTKDYKVPDTDVLIEKGTTVLISLLGIHNDPEYYPNPEIFDPMRFTEENRATRSQFTWLAFGGGPRSCIGLRFAMTEMRTALIIILKNFKISLNEKTKTPIVLAKGGVTLATKSVVWLDFQKL